MVDSNDSLLLGSTIGKYLFKYQIGKGATAEIWKCEDVNNSLVVAKFVSRGKPYFKELAEYTRKEYEFYKQIEHPSLPKVYEIYENTRGFFMFMEYLNGANLVDAFQQNVAQYSPFLSRYILKMINVLDYIHKLKVIHCDIKPENFVVDLKGNLWLIDFSLMRRDRFSLTNLFVKAKIEGTPEYMSPEQIMGSSITRLSDYYSLGLVFYFLCTGKKAFESSTAEEALKKNLYEEPRELTKISSDLCCPTMGSLIKKLTMKKPQDRIKSLAEVKLMFLKTRLGKQEALIL